jgi:hypothetical protein
VLGRQRRFGRQQRAGLQLTSVELARQLGSDLLIRPSLGHHPS